MFIRKTFHDFLVLQSEADPAPVARDWVVDWRWFGSPDDDPASISEHSLIDCAAWAKPRKPRPGLSARR
jgi:hypothetical protein